MKRTNSRIQAAVLSLALLLPAGNVFAASHHHRRHYHHYSRTRGTVVGAVAGAVVGGKKGALVGAALGNAIQYERTERTKH
jgi:uncharacterized membrane protein YfcA